MSDEDSIQETKILKRLSMNTRLSAARIFEEESNDSIKSVENKSVGKMKSRKKDVKSSPYKKQDKEEKHKKAKIEYEKDPAILERRQKQIDYGKNTAGYDNYIRLVPKDKRTNDHPKTPTKHLKYSRRGWDGLIKTWRQQLHTYDPDEINNKSDDKTKGDEENIEEDFEDIDRNFIDFV